jgi:ribonuclease-3
LGTHWKNTLKHFLRDMKSFETLCEKLGYSFQDEQLLITALTHRSMGEPNNERLEFLGDALLNFVIAEKLYQELPDLPEGELSRLRASLVKGDTLADLAKELTINRYMRLGVGEIKTGGAERASILANSLEAMIGAIHLDGGTAVCQDRILQWFEARLIQTVSMGVQKDPKTRLQEYLQSKKLPLPDYKILSVSGQAHAQVFKVECTVSGLKESAIGEGRSRRRAEQDAAQKFLEYL